MSRRAHSRIIVVLLLAFVCSACATKKPILYPNAKIEQMGREAADAAVDDCCRQAEDFQPEDTVAQDVALDAAVNTGAGAAAGAVSGAIFGRAGAGAAAGAVAGAVGTLFRAGLTKREPDPIRRTFTERCLRDQGYEIAGWR